MTEQDCLECAPSTSCCGTSLPTNGTITVEEEKQVIIDAGEASSFDRKPGRYASFIVNHPFVVLLIILVKVVLCACFSLIPQLGAPPVPNFDEPIKGFEARGTIISDRWRSQTNLFLDEKKGSVTRVPKRCGVENPLGDQQIGDAPATCNENITFSLGKMTMKLAFKARDEENLFTAMNLKSICYLEDKVVREHHSFDLHCHKINGTSDCCPSWSLGNYVALLRGRKSCQDINENDVKQVGKLLKRCSKYYHDGTLTASCWQTFTGCNKVPKECTAYNAVYNILHYLTDKNFLADAPHSSLYLRHTLVLVPTKEDEAFQKEVYESRLHRSGIKHGNVVLSGFELSQLKFAIFGDRLLADLYLAAIAMFFIMTILWIYTRSFLITFLVGLIVVSSLIIAYFIYTVVLGMTFFPFLNILTFVFLVGIAADDAFVYMDIWNKTIRERKVKQRRPTNKEDITQEFIFVTAETMKHASLSMFVTSFTTSSAFFASLTSEITSIRLFGLYSGLSILCMLLLMVTWFPAAVIIDQAILSRYTCCSAFCSKLKNILYKDSGIFKTTFDKLVGWHRTFFNDFLPSLIIRLRYLWVVFFFLLAAAGIVVSTVKPGLQLPSSQDFQMFHESHVLENYQLRLKKNFHFETTKRSRFAINIILGIKPLDSGDQLNPYDMGKLMWDNDFNIASAEGQIWIRQFISRIKKQPFFAKKQASGENCFIEQFFLQMQKNCTSEDKICCSESNFPYNMSTLFDCLLKEQCKRISRLKFLSQSITDEAPLFDDQGRVKALLLTFDSDVAFTWSFEPADKFWKQTESWVAKEFSNAPSSTNGWFISELQFYDLQRSLSRGTFMSMSISLAIAFGVMLITTGNIYISVFAIVTITCALGVTVGSLVLMGWKLNILESITLSVAVGLSVDFALHYGVAFVLATDKTERKERVLFSVTGMGSAITMAAFTTFITGAIATQSTVLSYIQLGQFLMIIMSVSWIYATFFFQALCSIFGPENASGQLTASKCKNGYKKFKNCGDCRSSDTDHYQIVTKQDGTQVKRYVKVIYVK